MMNTIYRVRSTDRQGRIAGTRYFARPSAARLQAHLETRRGKVVTIDASPRVAFEPVDLSGVPLPARRASWWGSR